MKDRLILGKVGVYTNKVMSIFGLSIKRIKHHSVISEMICKYPPRILLDVGASIGKYASELRTLGYKSIIHSFEPQSVPFNRLKKTSSSDTRWYVHNFALGSGNEKQIINISNTFDSSSLLNMLPLHLKAAPKSRYIRKEEINVKTLDYFITENDIDLSDVVMKVDTQGYELEVLQGGSSSLAKIDRVILELSLDYLYESQPIIDDMLVYMYNMGYKLAYIEKELFDKNTNYMLQVNGYFVRK